MSYGDVLMVNMIAQPKRTCVGRGIQNGANATSPTSQHVAASFGVVGSAHSAYYPDRNRALIGPAHYPDLIGG